MEYVVAYSKSLWDFPDMRKDLNWLDHNHSQLPTEHPGQLTTTMHSDEAKQFAAKYENQGITIRPAKPSESVLVKMRDTKMNFIRNYTITYPNSYDTYRSLCGELGLKPQDNVPSDRKFKVDLTKKLAKHIRSVHKLEGVQVERTMFLPVQAKTDIVKDYLITCPDNETYRRLYLIFYEYPCGNVPTNTKTFIRTFHNHALEIFRTEWEPKGITVTLFDKSKEAETINKKKYTICYPDTHIYCCNGYPSGVNPILCNRLVSIDLTDEELVAWKKKYDILGCTIRLANVETEDRPTNEKEDAITVYDRRVIYRFTMEKCNINEYSVVRTDDDTLYGAYVSWCAAKDYETCGGVAFHKILDAMIEDGAFGTTNSWTYDSSGRSDESNVVHYNHRGTWYYVGLSLDNV